MGLIADKFQINKLTLFLEVMAVAFFAICVFAPLWVYYILMVILVFESFTMCSRYLMLLNRVKDISYHVLRQQRKIIGYAVLSYGCWAALSLYAIYYLSIHIESYFGYKPNMYNFADPLILLLTSTKLLLFGLTMALIHFIVILRIYFGVPFDLPPLACLISKMIRKLKQESGNL